MNWFCFVLFLFHFLYQFCFFNSLTFLRDRFADSICLERNVVSSNAKPSETKAKICIIHLIHVKRKNYFPVGLLWRYSIFDFDLIWFDFVWMCCCCCFVFLLKLTQIICNAPKCACLKLIWFRMFRCRQNALQFKWTNEHQYSNEKRFTFLLRLNFLCAWMCMWPELGQGAPLDCGYGFFYNLFIFN